MPPGPGRQEAEVLALGLPEGRFDRIVRLAQAIFGAPIAELNLIGNEAQFSVATVGLPKGTAAIEDSICQVTVQQDELLEVHDLREDDRFAQIPSVTDSPRLRFYAGVPVRGQSGQNVGALCILDLTPRTLGHQQREMLSDLGVLLERELAAQEEMDLAGQVQKLMRPTSAPDIAGVEIAGRVQPARAAGGDYYDWFVVNCPDSVGQRLQVTLGDVMGKGLAAALIASEVRAVLHGHSQYTDVSGAIERTLMTTQRDLEANNRFTTLWVGRLDPASGQLEYVDAGHGLAIIASQRGYRRLEQSYMPLGISRDETWEKATDVLAKDELLLVVSDGVFDVLDDSFDEVEARLPYILDPGLSCHQIVDMIVDFAVSKVADDDVTALAVRRTVSVGKGNTTPEKNSKEKEY
ncbi:MAG: SpoIIE family protein phosphatase [Micrococcales bacterium]|nr:SpoIIE family protein phosphatase [Micrococcales bacterium]